MRKQEKKTSMIWAGFIAFLMLSSILGFAILGKEGAQNQKYGKYKFTKLNQGWTTKINNKNILFNYYPSELESINLSQNIINSIKNSKMTYLTFDPGQNFLEYADLARFQITDSFQKFLGIYVNNAITNKSSDYSLNVITCTNSTSSVPVIFLKQGNETGFYKKENCIIMQSTDGYGFLRLKDRLIYGLLNIIR